MKRKIKAFGVIIFIIIIGFSIAACSDPNDQGSNTPFIIAGSFTNESEGINAKFYASSADGRSIRAARSAANEVEMEGLLEDGGITFKLKGSYNSATRLYVLSAASSILRFSISGDLDSSEPGKAIVQVKSGNDWIVIEIDVAVTTSGGSFSSKGEVQDALANGIPQNMWGIWWGSEPVEKGKGDIVEPDGYYYAIDAFTIVQYVMRHGTWNVEGYDCFFEGLTTADGVSSGIIEFKYQDQEKIDTDYPTWWIECIADYAEEKSGDKNKILTQDWLNPEYTAYVNSYAAGAQADGAAGRKWIELFGDEPYSYKAYRKDALKLQNANQLQIGKYYNNWGIYFSKNANDVNSFSDLRWESNIYSRAVRSPVPPAPSQDIIVDSFNKFNYSDYIDLSSTKNYQIVDIPSEGRKSVLKVSGISGVDDEWAIGIHQLTQHKGRTATISFSADVKRVGADGNLMWQMSTSTFPIVGNPIMNAPANMWHYMSGTWTGELAENDQGYAPDLYLTAYQNNSPDTTYYIDNFSITAVIDGEYHLTPRYTWTDGGDERRGWLLSSEIRAKIADGSLKYFVIGLDADAVQTAGGLLAINIGLNRENGFSDDSKAFPWYFEEDKTGDHADLNGWISYEDLVKPIEQGGYGAIENEYSLWLQYDLAAHPGYEAFKTAMASAYWAQIGLAVWDNDGPIWRPGNQWVPIKSVFFKPGN